MEEVSFSIVGVNRVWETFFGEWVSYAETPQIIEKILASKSPIVIDTETTGLNYFLHKVFSFGIKVDGHIYYFNFKDYSTIESISEDFTHREFSKVLPILEMDTRWIGHNLKFDWHMIYHTFGVKLKGELWDTMVIERLLSNDEMRYNLDSCVKRNLPGYEKDDGVEKYIEKHNLFRTTTVFGKKKPFIEKFYHLVPFSVVAPYAAMDVDITERLYQSQLSRMQMEEERNSRFGPKLRSLSATECKLLNVCAEVEERGVLINRQFVQQGLEHEAAKQTAIERWFELKYNEEFVDSIQVLAPKLKEIGVETGSTEKGNESIAETVLASSKEELPQKILAHREAAKRKDTYFQSFLTLSQADGFLHPDMKQSGTRTGRFSFADPNLQNVPAEDDSDYPIRRALVPSPGYFFFMPDYNQMEFRMMLDYAGELGLINKILEGHDPHQATADMTGLSRKAAKTLNFGLLYGMGIQKLANALGISYDEAKAFKYQYFGALPRVKALIYQASDIAKERGFVYTWAGRKLDFKNPNFAYKAINGIIQGGCADVVKEVMTLLHGDKRMCGSRIIMQVHDELLFEVPLENLGGLRFIKDTMEGVYKYNHLPLTVGLSYSLESFHDGIEAKSIEEIEAAIGERTSGQGAKVSSGFTQHLVC